MSAAVWSLHFEVGDITPNVSPQNYCTHSLPTRSFLYNHTMFFIMFHIMMQRIINNSVTWWSLFI